MAATAQASLSDLEKHNAPIVEQVEQASIFSGSNNHSGLHHGREEWALRWTLKKLNAVKEVGMEARGCAEIWVLLKQLIRKITVVNVARVLAELKFIDALALAIGELQQASVESGVAHIVKASKSKKRKHDGSPVNQSQDRRDIDAVRCAIGKVVETLFSLNTSTSFEKEHILSVFRTSSDMAADILGGWLATMDKASEDFLSPFLLIWTNRSSGTNDAEIFASKCLKPLLNLLRATSDTIHHNVKVRLQETLARDVINPARNAYLVAKSPDTFKTLCANVTAESADITFTIVIRCVSTQINRRRKTHDTDWLQAVFMTLLDIVKASDDLIKLSVITSLLQTCLDHGIKPSLITLQDLVDSTPFTPTTTYWTFIRVVLKQDSDVFISSQDSLLPALVKNISSSSQSQDWPTIADLVIDGVAVLLMEEFTKARKLVEFVPLWRKAIAELNVNASTTDIGYYSAWEDEALRTKFKQLMEISLSTSQIADLIDEVVSDNNTDFEAVVVINAIAGAVIKEDTIDAIGLGLYRYVRLCAEHSNISITSKYSMHLSQSIHHILAWRTPQIVTLDWETERIAILERVVSEVSSLLDSIHTATLNGSSSHLIASHSTSNCNNGAVELFNTFISNLNAYQDYGVIASQAQALLPRIVAHFHSLVTTALSLDSSDHVPQHGWNNDYSTAVWKSRRLRHSGDALSMNAYLCDLAELLLVKNAGALLCSRRETAEVVVRLAFASKKDETLGTVIRSLVLQMINLEGFTDKTELVTMFIDVLIQEYGQHDKGSRSRIVEALRRIPIQAFSKQQREAVLTWYKIDHDNLSFAEMGVRMLEYVPSKLRKASQAKDEAHSTHPLSHTQRLSLRKDTIAAANKLEEQKRPKYVESLFSTGISQHDLLSLLAGRHAVTTCSRDADLSSIYSILAESLPKVTGFRQFCIISETMELMLRTNRITQQNIDTTISSITTICSAASPTLPPKRAGTIFLHITHLLRTILLSHRMQLQGHLNTMTQVMIMLLLKLCTPLSTSTATTSSLKSTFPSWSSTASHPMSLVHAQAYTRLLTLLCDPSTSSISRASTNSLNSATAKVKRTVGQHMPLIVSAFIRYQLDSGLRMNNEVREEVARGLWSVFDVMSVEGRRVLGESMDSSGRAVLNGLVRDWSMFGKWKGL